MRTTAEMAEVGMAGGCGVYGVCGDCGRWRTEPTPRIRAPSVRFGDDRGAWSGVFGGGHLCDGGMGDTKLSFCGLVDRNGSQGGQSRREWGRLHRVARNGKPGCQGYVVPGGGVIGGVCDEIGSCGECGLKRECGGSGLPFFGNPRVHIAPRNWSRGFANGNKLGRCAEHCADFGGCAVRNLLCDAWMREQPVASCVRGCSWRGCLMWGSGQRSPSWLPELRRRG